MGHFVTTMCRRGVKCKHHHLAVTDAQVSAGTEFRAQYQVLEQLDTFKYLGRMLYFDNIKWPMVDWNL